MPDWRSIIREQLRGLKLAPSREAEIVDELEQHLEDRYRELRASGSSDEAAYSAVLNELRDDGLLAAGLKPVEIPADEPGWSGGFFHDIRHAVRMLRSNAAFTAVAVLTLALGIGGNTAIFSVVDAVLLNSVPFYNDPESIVVIWGTRPGEGNRSSMSLPDFEAIRSGSASFESMAIAFGERSNVTGSDEPIEALSYRVSADLLRVVGAQTALGRWFDRGEELFGNHQVVVLSDGLWRRAFGADAGVIGRQVAINGIAYRIIGVMPAGFQFPAANPVDFWRPFAFDPSNVFARNDRIFYPVVARLKPGVTVEQAGNEVRAIMKGLELEYPATNEGWSVIVRTIPEDVTVNIRPTLLVLMGAVGLVLLIACVNVANLLLALAASREREFAVRTSLGASRFRIFRQLATESLVLAFIAAAAGLVFAYGAVRMIVTLGPPTIPRLSDVSVNSQAVLFTTVVALAATMLFGIAPSMLSSRVRIVQTLKEGGRGRMGARRTRLALQALVLSEVMLALMLLAGAGLLIRSFNRLQQVDVGFNPSNVLALRVSLSGEKYAEREAEVMRELLARLASLPGVQSAGSGYYAAFPILGGSHRRALRVVGAPENDPVQTGVVGWRLVTPDYFRTLGIPLLKGRLFTEDDSGQAPLAGILNNAAANRFFPGEDPTGKLVRVDGTRMMIVGVVGDVKYRSPDGASTPDVFMPYYRPGALGLGISRAAWIVLKTATNPLNIAGSVRAEIRAAEPDLPVADVTSMEEVMDRAVAEPRFSMIVIGLLAAVAVILAVVGIYGLMAHFVNERRYEIGVRLALGAQTTDVFRLILGHGMVLVAIGVALGIAGAFALTRMMGTLLFEVSATDPLTFGAVAILLVVVAFAACCIPARRATQVDPMTSVRCE